MAEPAGAAEPLRLEPGQVVWQGAMRSGRPLLLRTPRPGDAPALLDFINTISQERTFIRMQGETLTLEQEQAFLDAQLAHLAARTGVLLEAWSGARLIGVAGVHLRAQIERHVAEFGISVAAEWRGDGVGTRLMLEVQRVAEASLPGLRVVVLSVFGNNPNGARLYRRHGFLEFGRLPGGVLHRDELVDHIHMYRPARRAEEDSRPG